MDSNTLVRWDEIQGASLATTYRLLTIPNSVPDSLATGYQPLTGKLPFDRLSDDPRRQDQMDVTSREVTRQYLSPG